MKSSGNGAAGSQKKLDRPRLDREFLFSISEKIRISRSSEDLLAEIAEMLGRHLGLHRCLFNEIDLENDAETVHRDYARAGESVAGKHKISDYSKTASESMRAGRTVVNRDSRSDPRTAELFDKTYGPNKELAYIAVPMLRGGRWVASLWCSDDQPRDWTEQEIELVENIAERAWTAVERLRMEELLRRNEQMFSTLVEAAPFGVYFIDSDFRLISINRGAQAVFSGIDPLIGRDFAEILRIVWPEPFATEAIEKFRHTLRTGEPYLAPTVTEKRANVPETESYDWQIHRITLADGGYGVVCYFYDLSFQKRLESDLRESEAKLRAIYSGTFEYIGLLAPDGTLLDTNRASLRFADNTRESVIGRPFWKTPWFTSTPGAPDQMSGAIKLAAAGAFVRQEITLNKPNGEAVTFDFSIHPIKNEKGETIFLVPEFRDIGDLKEATDALRRSEQRLRQMSDAMPQVVWVADESGRVDYYNRQVARFGRVEKSANNSYDWRPIIHEDDIAATEDTWAKAAAELSPYAHEHRILMADGSYRWHLSRAVPALDPDGRTRKWYGTATDIHELKEAEERLQLALDAGHLGTWENLLDTRKIFWDERTRDLFGVSRDEEITYEGAIWRVIPEEDHERVRSAAYRAFDPNGDGVYDMEHRVRLPDGSIRWLHSVGRVEFARTGKDHRPLIMRGTVQDITERVNAGTALRASEEKFRTLFESIDEGFVIIEMIFDDDRKPVDYRFIEANPSFTKLTGLSDDAVGKTARDLVPNLEEFWFDTYGRVALTGEPVRFEHRSEMMGRWFDVYASRVGGPESNRVSIVFNNITARKKAEQDLAFLAEISQELLVLASVDELVERIGSRIGAYLKISLCTFVEIDEDENRVGVPYDWHRPDVPGVVGNYSLGDYVSEDYQIAGRAGRTFVINDTQSDPRADAERYATLRIGSYACFPLLRDGRWRFMFCIHHSEPHIWTAEELELGREIAERSWTGIEKVRAESALRESEERLRLATGAAQIFSWETDFQADTLKWSDNAARIIGCEESDLGKRSNDGLFFVHPEDKPQLIEHFAKLTASGDENFLISFRGSLPASEEKHWQAQGRVIYDAEGEPARVVGVTQDVTRQRLASEKLRESYEFNQDVIDSITAHIAVVDENGMITAVNEAWRRFAIENGADWTMNGCGVGTNYLAICGSVKSGEAADAAAIYRGIASVLKGQSRHFTLEYPCHSPTTQRWFLLTVSPLGRGGAVIAHQNITERRKTEAQIRESEQRFQLAQDAGNVGVWDWDRVSNTTYWSDTMWKFYGESPGLRNPDDEFWTAHLHPADRDRVKAHLAETLASDAVQFRDEFRILNGKNETTWIESIASIVREGAGEAVRMYGVNVDVTERKSNEERIKTNEAQLRLVTDSMPALISYLDTEKRYRFVNKTYSEWFGKAPSEIVGKTIKEIVGASAYNTVRPHVERVLKGEPVSLHAELDYAAVGTRYVHIGYVPDIGTDGAVRGFFALITDLTDLRRSDELLQSTEQRIAILMENVADYAIISTNTDGIVESWNTGAEKIFGHAADEIIGKSADILFTPADVSKGIPANEMRNARQMGRATDERWHLRKDGTRFFASGVMMPLMIDQRLTGYAKIATDLTEKRRRAEELQKAHDELEMRVFHRTKELGETNELLRLEVEQRKASEIQRVNLLHRIVSAQESERKRIARDIHDQFGQRLTALRLKLAALNDVSSDPELLTARVARLQEIARSLDAEVSFLASQLRPSVLDDLGLEEALRAYAGEWSGHFDIAAGFHSNGVTGKRFEREVETQLYRIAQEALTNIAKHANATEVTILLERTAEFLVLIVEDNGSGFQTPETDPADGKQGLGLIGMKERASLIGAEIEIESSPDFGTTIFVKLPNK